MFNILSFLNLDIVPTLVTVVKYGSIALGLNMTKKMPSMSNIMSFDMKGAMFDGLKLMRPSQFAVIVFAFFFSKASITLSSLAIPTLNVLILLTAVFLLLVLLYVGAVFYQARYNNNSYNLQDDDFGIVILKSLLAIVEIIVVGVILAASMFGVSQALLFFTTLKLELIVDISYIAAFSVMMLFNYVYEKEDLIYDFLPKSIKDWFGSLSLNFGKCFAIKSDQIMKTIPHSSDLDDLNEQESRISNKVKTKPGI